jgi:hypothetical protein
VCTRDRGDQIDKEAVVELGEEKQNPRASMPARARNDNEHGSDIARDGAVPCVSVRRGCKFEKQGRQWAGPISQMG